MAQRFVIEVIVDPTKSTQGTRKVRGELDKTEIAANRVQKAINRAFTIAAFTLAIRQVGKYADAFTNVQNRLRTVTEGQAQLTSATNELFEIADRTRSAFGATAEVYARVGLAARELGRDQEELLSFTESLNQAVILSGASATEAQAGLLQLSQGLASGALRGDELRSVLEQLPVVADVIAKSLGVTRGELRLLGQEGKISAEIVLDAFKESREELEERFGKTVPTLSQSFTVLENNVIRYVGAADQAIGASADLSKTIIVLADNIDTLVAVATTVGVTFAAIRFAPVATEALAAAAAFVKVRVAIASGRAVTLGSAAALSQQAIAESVAAQSAAVRTGVLLAQARAENARALAVAGSAETMFIQAAVEKQLIALELQHVAAQNAAIVASMRAQASLAATTIRARALSLLNPFAIAVVGATAFGFALSEILDNIIEYEDAALKATEAGEKFALTDFGKIGADIVRVEDEISRLQENIDRDLATKGFANPTAIAALERYEEKLQRLTEEQGLLADGTARSAKQAQEQIMALKQLAEDIDAVIGNIEQENELLQLNSREREVQSKLLREIAELEEKGPNLSDTQKAELEAAIRMNQALQDQADVLDRIQGPQQQFKSDLAALDALFQRDTISEEQFNAELERLLLNSDGVDLSGLDLSGFSASLDGVDLEKLRELLAATTGAAAGFIGPPSPISATPDLGLDAQLATLEAIRGPQLQFMQTQAALNDLLAAGAISADEYAIALNDATIAANTISTSASQGLAAGLATVENKLLDVSGAVSSTVVNAFGNAEDAIVQFATTGELNFSAFADGLLADVARILARQALLALLNAFSGGTASTAADSFIGPPRAGPPRARGGDVGPNQEHLVGEEGPELFTPRGAGRITPAGETAAIMQRQTSAAATAVNVTPTPINIINVTDPNEVPNGIESAQGEQAVMNVIRKNRRTVRGTIG